MSDLPAHILLADDDALLRDHAVAQLADEPLRITTADNGMTALERLRSEEVELVLLDLVMPCMDGYEVLEAMRADQRWRATPVIVITGRDDPTAIDRAYELGATGFCVKPVNWRLMARQIRFTLRADRADKALRLARARLHERYTQGADAAQALLASASTILELARDGDAPMREAAKGLGRQIESLRAKAADPGLTKTG